MWYVVQTQASREQQICDKIIEAAAAKEVPAAAAPAAGSPVGTPAPAAPLLDEAFVPRYRTGRKVDGAWQPMDAVLFPGYLIVVTRRANDLAELVRKIPEFSRMIGQNDNVFVPLSDEEVAWIDAFTQRGHRVIGKSTAVREGDRVTVIDGPLLHREGWIRKVNDRKKVAYLELEMFGTKVQAQVGIDVLRKR